MEESKLTRTRDAAGIPRAAIRFCFERAGIQWADVSHVAVASRPVRGWLRRAWFRLKMTPRAPLASFYYQSKAMGEMSREVNNFRILRTLRQHERTPVLALEQHLCHAASAFYASPFDRAAILTLDEDGDGLSGMLAVGEGTRIRVLRRIAFPHSLGWLFSHVTQALGFAPFGAEHKTQWLSLGGEPSFADFFLEILGGAAAPRMRAKYFQRGFAGRMAFSDELYRRLGFPPGQPETMSDDLRRAVAASVQQACARAAANLARKLALETGAKALCLAGGLFLNAPLVEYVEKEAGLDQVFVQPAAGNEGTALGAAWLVEHQMSGRPRREPLRHLYLGPSFSNEEIKRVVDNCKLGYRWSNTEDERTAEVIRLLEAGRIVAWFHGAAEFGPRALGNRSLLASPWAPYVKENLNEFVKHREPFRPFALAVPEEDAAKYFESTPANRFMASLAHVKPEAQAMLEGFVLPGNRVRLHAVDRETNPLLWRLLKKFGERAQAPLLVNTSFNLFGEPLVVTPRDAIRSYACSGTDAMSIGSFLLTKS